MKKLLYISLVHVFLIGCDVKPIDYDNHIHKSSYVRAGSTQTGRLRKAHARMGVSSSSRAFKSRIRARSYYNTNSHRRKLRNGD